MKVVVRRALPPPVRGRRRRRGAIIAYMVLAFVVFLGMGALVIDMGVHYQRKASLQVLADMAAIQSLAGTDPALSYADEDASIRKFVANISSANGYARDLFRVNTYPCNSQGYPCGFATTDHGHSSAHDAEHQDCQGPTHQHSGGGDSGKGDSGKSSRLPENEPEGGTSPNSVPLASPRELAFLSTLGILPQEELPAWRKSGALNLADAHNGVGNDVHSGHSGHGMVASMPTPTVADICRVEVSATVSSPSFFAAIFRISSFTIGIWAVAQRDVNTTTPTRPPCAFWGRSSVRIFGNPFLDSYDSSLGSSYVSQAIHTDSNGLGFAREQAVGCSDSTMDYNGNIDHHGGASSVGQLSISGNSFDIFGNVTTGGPAAPTSFSSNVHPTTIPVGSGTIATNATVPPLNPPDVDFTEACSLPRPSGSTYCPKASATANDNSIHVTGWFDSSALSGSTKTLTNGTGSGSSSSCDGSDDKKRICLDAGYTYYFKNIDLKNTTTLAIRGTSLFKTIIYLDCESSCSRVFKMAGQTSFAATARPADTLLYMGSSTLNLPEACSSGLPSVQITGGGTLMADLYAPGYDLQLTGNGGIFGRVYATNVSFGGTTAFHYDESLGGIGASGSATAPRQRVILVE